MYKLLIVDDEPFILDGLVELFRENPQLDVYSASSGAKAIELLDHTRMDIVLTDIQMPGMSGLELQLEIRRRWPYCKLVFLTAHHEFQYAHQAIKHDAAGYVLKSEGERALVEAVDRCIGYIVQERQVQAFREEHAQYMASALPMLQSACLLNVLEGERDEVNQANFEKYEMQLDESKPSILVALRLDRGSLRPSLNDQLDLFIQIKAIFRRYLSDAYTGYETIIDNRNMIWLLQMRGPVHRLLYLRETLEIVQAHVLQALNASISVIYDDFAEWRELPGRFRAIKIILNQMAVHDDERVLAATRFYFAQPDTEAEGPEADPAFLHHLPLLQRCLEDEDAERFAATLRGVLEGNDGRDALVAHLELYHALTNMVLAYIKSRKLSQELFADPDNFAFFFQYCDKETLERSLVQLVERIFAIRERKQSTQSQQFATRINRYISGHLADDLSLSALAEKFYLNPVYMSRLYKQTTGHNLTDYIARRRIEHSQRLLLETEYKIHRIATESGFESAAYFTRVFKKLIGITPIEYRNRHDSPGPQ